MLATLNEVKSRVKACCPEEILVSDYCVLRSVFRNADLDLVKRNLIEREDGFWEFSSHKGLKGKRVIIYFQVSRNKVHKYVLEVNSVIYLINVIIIEGKKQKGFV